MSDFPYALDLDLIDPEGRKLGMFHVRAGSAGDFLAELREIDPAFGTALSEAVSAIKTYGLLNQALGARPVASGGYTAPTPPPAAPSGGGGYESGWPSGPSDSPYDDAPPTVPSVPTCSHGPMRYVAAGTSRNGKPYGAFYGCQADRNDPNRCKSQSA